MTRPNEAYMFFMSFPILWLQVKHCLEIGISADSASKLFIFQGLASSVSRVMVGRLCDIRFVNAIYVHQFGDLLVGFMTLALPLLRSYAGILAFSVVYGIGDGIFVTTMNSLLLFTVDEKQRAAALGLGSCLIALSVGGGPPLAGKFVHPPITHWKLLNVTRSLLTLQIVENQT